MLPYSITPETQARLEAITCRVGFALLQVQALEGGAAQYLVLCSKNVRGMGAEAAATLLNKAQRETFGTTVGGMRTAGLLSEDLESRFKVLLNERNWLVHRSRADSSKSLQSDDAALAMVERINLIAEESRLLMSELAMLSSKFVRSAGITQEAIEEATSELMRRWESNDAI